MSKQRIHDSTKRRRQPSHSVGSHQDKYAAKTQKDFATKLNSGEILQNQGTYFLIRRIMPNALNSVLASGYSPFVELISPEEALELKRRETLERTRSRFSYGKIGNLILPRSFTVVESQLLSGQLVHKVAIDQLEPGQDLRSDQEAIDTLLNTEDDRASTLIIPVQEDVDTDRTTEILKLEFTAPRSLSKAHIVSSGTLEELYRDVF